MPQFYTHYCIFFITFILQSLSFKVPYILSNGLDAKSTISSPWPTTEESSIDVQLGTNYHTMKNVCESRNDRRSVS